MNHGTIAGTDSSNRDPRQSLAAPVRHRHFHHRSQRRDRGAVLEARLRRGRDERRRPKLFVSAAGWF